MYVIKRTHARANFKDLLGQANHFIITLLIGLNAVREGQAELADEFRTLWNPQDVVRSADRSRHFVLDLALVRAVDALDSYFMTTNRKPFILSDPAFIESMNSTGQKITKRAEVFSKFLEPIQPHQKLLLKIAISWRNKRVHSLSDDKLTNNEEAEILSLANEFEKDYSGLEIASLLSNYKSKNSPSFKEAAAFIRLMHQIVEHFDKQLLQLVDIETYLRDLIAESLLKESGLSTKTSTKRACKKIWRDDEKRGSRIIRLLRMIGVIDSSKFEKSKKDDFNRAIPNHIVDSITNMSPDDAHAYLYPSLSK